jgi:Pectate lyase superfamily protein/Right handed beta helix region
MMQRRKFLGHLMRAAVAGGTVLAAGRRAWPLVEGVPGSARRASVVDFGADPTGQRDATAAVQKAIASLARRNARLVFPAGKYTFAASDQVLMDFRGYEGLEIFGNRAELHFAGRTQPFRLTSCKDLEIHDIIVDWSQPPSSQEPVHSAAADAALRLYGCEQILLEAVVFHAAPGAAAVLSGCRDITLDAVRVIPHPASGREISSGGDGVEMLDSTGTVSVQHALISGTGGAGMRVQQAYWRMSQVIDPQTALLASSDGHAAPEWLLPAQGTYMQLSEAGTLRLLGEIAVSKAEAAPGGMRVSFAETLSAVIGKGTLLCLSASNQAQLKIDDCKFGGGPHAGLVAQSRARISNSSFNSYGGPAILLAPDLARMRGPVVENIHITDCSFTHCNLTPGTEWGAITIDTQLKRSQPSTPASRINEGITVQRNVFSQLGGPAIYCADASWLDVESNRFSDCDTRRSAGEKPRAILLRNVDESTIAGNEATTPAKILMIDCTEKVKADDNGPLTNAIS